MSDKQAVDTTPEQTQARVSSRAVRKGKQAIEKNFRHLEKLQITELDVAVFTPNDWNPNRQSDHDFELLLKSMQEDGFTQPVIALQTPNDLGLYIIVDGEHRWRAATTLGYKSIPAVLVDMTPEQARISTIRHNRARGTHDITLEAEILRDLQKLGALDIAADSLLLDETELNMLLKDFELPDELADADYTEAWTPDTFTDADRDLISHGEMQRSVETDSALTGVTPQAIEAQRRREKLLEKAKDEEERKRAIAETNIYRLALVFSGDEALTVRKVLRESPAEIVLQMCKERLDQGL